MCRLLDIVFAILATIGYQPDLVAGKLIERPRDTEVKVNHSIYFNCSTDRGPTAIFWFHGTKYVYTGGVILDPYHDRFEIDQFDGNGTYTYNLVIHSVQPGDAGKYICAEDEGSGEQHSIQLIVLEHDPICRSTRELDKVIGQNTCNIKPDKVEIECSAMYHGNIPPQIEWKKIGENSSTSLEVSVTTKRNEIVTTLKFTGEISLDDTSYVCEAKRSIQEPIKCTSEVIKILYANDDDSTVNGTIDDEIHCHANSSQSCNYRWKWLQDSGYTIESSTSVLKARKPGWHRCEAECSLRNITCVLLVMRARIYDETESRSTRTIIISVVVSVGVTLIVAVALICVFFRFIIYGHADSPIDTANGEQRRLLVELPKIYQTDPQLIHTINRVREEAHKSTRGLTILDRELFVVIGNSSELEVYDSMNFTFCKHLKLKELGLVDPKDIVSCKRNTCLYIFNFKGHGKENEILRVEPNGSLIKKWPTGNDYGHGLSVTVNSSVILTVHAKHMLHEYLPDGQKVKEIDISKTVGIWPWHAIQLTNGDFVVSHGGFPSDPHRLCLVNSDGEFKKAFGEICGTTDAQLNHPVYLNVDRNGFVMVADRDNRRVLLLDSDLKFRQEIIEKEKHKLQCPTKILLDESHGRLLVVDNNWASGGGILIYQLIECT